MEKDRLKLIVQHAANKISQISIYWDSRSKRKQSTAHSRERERERERESAK
jgi:hypothetical protein